MCLKLQDRYFSETRLTVGQTSKYTKYQKIRQLNIKKKREKKGKKEKKKEGKKKKHSERRNYNTSTDTATVKLLTMVITQVHTGMYNASELSELIYQILSF